MQEWGSSPGDGPKDVRPLLFGSGAEPTRPGRREEGCLKLMKAEVQIPGGGRSRYCKRGVVNSVGCHCGLS